MSDFQPPGGQPPSTPPPSEEPPQPGWWKASDGNWYPPEQAPQQPRPQAPPSPDQPPQPGWWKASDGNWYPPQQAPQPVPPPGQAYGNYAPQGYQPYLGGTATNTIATWSLVLGIASIVLFWTFGFGILLGILAIIFGVMGGNKAKELPGQLHDGRAKAGLITGVIGTVAGALFFVLIFAIADEVVDDIRDEINSDPPDGECDPDRFLQDPDC